MKTFELTQEQIKKLLQQFIPEAFETKLEVGRWYKLKDNPKILALYDCFKHHRPYAYLFNAKGDYEYAPIFSFIELPNRWQLATEEEVSEALINEAKKRWFNNIGDLKIKNIHGGISNGFSTINNDFYYDYISNTLQLDGGIIFKDGIWAEIIEPTKEEINRVLTFLKKQNEQ